MKIATDITSYIYGTERSYNKILRKQLANSTKNFKSPAKLIVNGLSFYNLKSVKWTISQRTNFFIYDEYIIVNGLKIDITRLDNVEIVNVKTWFGLLKYSILYFKYESNFYSIGLQRVLEEDKKYFKDVQYSEVNNLSYTIILPFLIILYFIYVNFI